MKTSLSILTLILGTAACGGTDSGSDNGLEPGEGNDPGAGTSTLLINGNVEASPSLTNAQTSADFDTDFEVRIMFAGQGVTTGTVTVTSPTGTYPLTYVGSDGQWEGRAIGYDEIYMLDVISGENEATGIQVDGPDLHSFVTPTAGASVDSTMQLEVTWDSEERADSTSIRTDNLDWLAIPDEGLYLLAGGALEADAEQAKTNELRLQRSNRVVPAGAIAGSEFSVRIENRIEVVAQPNPAL